MSRTTGWGRGLAALAFIVAVALAACGGGAGPDAGDWLKTSAGAEPQTGIWWNPAENGSGYAVERQGDIVTLGAYMYETDGKPVWYVGPLARQGDGSYRGQITRYAGGQTVTGAYRAPTSSAAAATVTFSLTTTTAGTLRFERAAGQHTVPVQLFALPGSARMPSAVGLENGLWWNEAEGGRGFFLDIQGSTAALSSYMYDASGQPVWYLTVGQVNGLTFSGQLLTYQGGQSLGGAYQAPQATGNAGNVTFKGITGTTAELTLPDGRVIPLKRLTFATGPGTPGSSAKLDGAYEGTVVNGTDTVRITMLALENEQVWLTYGVGPSSMSQLEGMLQVNGASANGAYSGSFLDVPGSEPVTSGTMTASFNNRVSVNGNVQVVGQNTPGVLTAGAIPTARYNYDQAASLATVTGTWPLVSTNNETGTMTVAANGNITGTLHVCTLAGTLAPRAGGKNVFNLTLHVSGQGDCNFSASGVAFNTIGVSGNSLLWMNFTNAARTDGGVIRGQR